MALLTVQEVFTPGSHPVHTYIQRAEHRFEQTLRDALSTPGQIVSLSGPSKSGKTVLVERVVGRDYLIAITGATVEEPAELWDRVLDWMDTPSETTQSTSVGGVVGATGEARGALQLPLVVRGEVGFTGDLHVSGDRSSSNVRRRRGLQQVVHEIGGSDFVLLIDDFHYMPRRVQEEVAKQLKEAARLGVKIVTAAVPHRSDDVVRANPELRGRVVAMDLEYREPQDLRAIADRGFSVLSVEMDSALVDTFVAEAAGSPQLMQAFCLHACFELGIRQAQTAVTRVSCPPADRRRIFERTAATTDFRSLVDVLDSGPKTRGTQRKIFQFKDGTTGDVYRCILKALAADPPRLSFPYDEIQRRTSAICVGEAPVGSSITGSCGHMAKLAAERFRKERVLDWDEDRQVLDVPEPYLLFYLRWSGHLRETKR